MRGLKDHTYDDFSLLYIASVCTFIRLSRAGSENYSLVIASLQQATQLFFEGKLQVDFVTGAFMWIFLATNLQV
jgi:hypothetical protein